jgi:hypothetical protein
VETIFEHIAEDWHDEGEQKVVCLRPSAFMKELEVLFLKGSRTSKHGDGYHGDDECPG